MNIKQMERELMALRKRLFIAERKLDDVEVYLWVVKRTIDDMVSSANANSFTPPTGSMNYFCEKCQFYVSADWSCEDVNCCNGLFVYPELPEEEGRNLRINSRD